MTTKKTSLKERLLHASRLLEHRARGLDEISETLAERYKERSVRRIWLTDSSENAFAATVFYESDNDIKEAATSGLSSEIVNALYEQLEEKGRGTRNQIALDVDFDSHESVMLEYNGNYLLRFK